jgi:hypothetical protein
MPNLYFNGAHRETAHAGEIPYEDGYLGFSESFDGEYFHFELFDGRLDETKRISLTPQEIEAIAKVGYLTESIEVDRLVEECESIGENMRERDRVLREIREKYEERVPPWDTTTDLETDYDAAHSWMNQTIDLGGGDGTPEYYSVEGWGIQRLDNGDFEVTTYKV